MQNSSLDLHNGSLNVLHQRAPIPVVDPQAFGIVRDAVDAAFTTPRVQDFLRSLERAQVRIRDFETVLNSGLLGGAAGEQYRKLPDGDQGQIRELYLASLEHVAPELRAKFARLYSYY